jgi:hypothetical protein
MTHNTEWRKTVHELYEQSKPGSRTPSELVDLFYKMLNRKGPTTIMGCEFSWVGRAVEEMKEKGTTPPPDKLAQIDATLCWMNTYWTAIDQVADYLVSAGVIPREYFDMATILPHIGLFTPHRSGFKALKEYYRLETYFHNYCLLSRAQHTRGDILPTRNIADVSFYCRPWTWLGEGVVFGRVPRAKLEEALTAVPSIGFIKDSGETDCTSDWYTYEKWTPWHHRLQVFVRRTFSKKSFMIEDNREKKNEIQKVLGTEVACVVEAGSKDLT